MCNNNEIYDIIIKLYFVNNYNIQIYNLVYLVLIIVKVKFNLYINS